MKKITALLLRLGVLVIPFVILIATAYQYISTKLDDLSYTPPGEMISVGSHRLHLLRSGQGGPTVVLDAGLRCCSLDWALVQPAIAQFTHVCSYDRAGTGWSEEGPAERNSETIVEELHTLLHNAKIPSPYILVGHSFGGMNARLFASRYPSEVLGLVIVDSPHEDLLAQTPPQPNKTFIENILYHPNVLLCGSYLGLHRFFQAAGTKRYTPPMFSQSIQEMYRAKTSTVKFARTTICEIFNLEKSIQQLQKQKLFIGNKPLIVITAGKAPESKDCGKPQQWINAVFQAHLKLQKMMVMESKQGKQIIACNSDHMIPLYQPEIIVDAVREIVEKTK